MSSSEPNKGDILLYSGSDGQMQLEVRLQDETLWLSQAQIATLFQVDRSVITKHLRNIFDSAELEKDSVCAKFAHTASDGKTYKTQFYNLDAIISVGYRVNSIQGTRFRIWASERLKEYLIKGFTMDDRRLKESDNSRYFEELLARIRDIRSSEKAFWRKVLEIYSTSIDYDPKAESSRLFFKQVQNKMQWASHGHTAAEVSFQRADADTANMGITNFPGDKLLKRDVEIAKNYLSQDELNILNRMVTAYLEMAELQALNQQAMKMTDWSERLDMFLTMTGRELLSHAGQISHDQAINKAHTEYEKFRLQELTQPSTVEKHFIEAERELKNISTKRRQDL